MSRVSRARVTRTRWGVRSTPAGSAAGSTAETANPATRAASSRPATTSGSPKPESCRASPVNTPVWTSPPTTSATWLDWPGSRETTSNRWLRNWARNPAAAARPPGVTSRPARTRAATRPAATPRALTPSRATRPRPGSGIGPGTSARAGAVAAASRARRCSNRVRASSTAAGAGGSAGAVRAIAGAASSALRWSSARVSAQEAQPGTWSCGGAGVPGASSSDARRAPRSGQGIVGSRVGVVSVEVGLAEGPLAAGQQDPDRADGQVEGGGDLRVGVAGVAQQQAGPLPLGQGVEGPAHRPLLLGPEHVQLRGRPGVGLVLGPLRPGGPVEPGRGPALAPQPVVGGVQADPAQPGRDLGVGPLQHRVPVELEEGLLDDVLGLAVVAEQPVPEPVELPVPLPEHPGEPLPFPGPGPSLIPHGAHQPLLQGRVWPRYLSPTPTPPGGHRLHPGPAAGGQVGDGRAGQLDQHHPQAGEEGDDQGRTGREDEGEGDHQDTLANAEAGRGEEGEEAGGVGGGVGGHDQGDVGRG